MALVVVVRFVCALFIVGVGLLVVILWIFEALFERVLALWPIYVTGLEGLVVALGETLVVSVVMLVVMIKTTMIVVVALNVLLVIVLTMHIATLVAVIVVPVALICKVANLVVVALCHFVAEFALGTKFDLFLTLLCKQDVGHLHIEDILEVLDDCLEVFVAEASSALKVPSAVLLAE